MRGFALSRPRYWSLSTSRSQRRSRSGPKITKLRIPASKTQKKSLISKQVSESHPRTHLEAVEGAVVSDGEDVVVDGEEVAVRRHQVCQVKCLS